MSDGTFEGYLAAWRDADPERRLAWLFLRVDERARLGGLAALQREWLKAVREVSEPQVAAMKLGWWREEVERAAAGDARHPLTQALFADPRVRAVPQARWAAAVDAALLTINASPVADFAAQRIAIAPLARAFGALETCVAFGDAADPGKAAAVCALGLLLANVRALAAEVGHGRSPLPMNLLARHGLTVEALLEDTPARRAALHDYADSLQRGMADAGKMRGSLTLVRYVQLQADLRALRAAQRSEDPWHGLRSARGGLRDVLKIWRAARISHHDSPVGKPDATT